MFVKRPTAEKVSSGAGASLYWNLPICKPETVAGQVYQACLPGDLFSGYTGRIEQPSKLTYGPPPPGRGILGARAGSIEPVHPVYETKAGLNKVGRPKKQKKNSIREIHESKPLWKLASTTNSQHTQHHLRGGAYRRQYNPNSPYPPSLTQPQTGAVLHSESDLQGWVTEFREITHHLMSVQTTLVENVRALATTLEDSIVHITHEQERTLKTLKRVEESHEAFIAKFEMVEKQQAEAGQKLDMLSAGSKSSQGEMDVMLASVEQKMLDSQEKLTSKLTSIEKELQLCRKSTNDQFGYLSSQVTKTLSSSQDSPTVLTSEALVTLKNAIDTTVNERIRTLTRENDADLNNETESSEASLFQDLGEPVTKLALSSNQTTPNSQACEGNKRLRLI